MFIVRIYSDSTKASKEYVNFCNEMKKYLPPQILSMNKSEKELHIKDALRFKFASEPTEIRGMMFDVGIYDEAIDCSMSPNFKEIYGTPT